MIAIIPEPEIPEMVQEVCLSFYYDIEKVWQLDVPASDMYITRLDWHFELPFLWESGRKYSLTPRELIAHPEHYPDEYARVMAADLAFPIDIIRNKGRWFILDGLHRLIKAALLGHRKVAVRVILWKWVPQIQVCA